MFGPSRYTYPQVLHIRPSVAVHPVAREVDDRLSSAGMWIDRCTDVYRGLARLCRTPPDQLLAVFVCVDGLSRGELEFFALIRQQFRALKVYVYGSKRSGSRVALAVERGATGPLDEGVLKDLVSAAADDLYRGASPFRQKGATVRTADPPWSRPPNEERDEAAREVEGRSAEPTVQGEARPVSVPWRPHPQRPVRRGPPSARSTEAPPETEGGRSRREPLLTEEELRALMDNDIAAITPGRRTPTSEGDGPPAAPPGDPHNA